MKLLPLASLFLISFPEIGLAKCLPDFCMGIYGSVKTGRPRDVSLKDISGVWRPVLSESSGVISGERFRAMDLIKSRGEMDEIEILSSLKGSRSRILDGVSPLSKLFKDGPYLVMKFSIQDGKSSRPFHYPFPLMQDIYSNGETYLSYKEEKISVFARFYLDPDTRKLSWTCEFFNYSDADKLGMLCSHKNLNYSKLSSYTIYVLKKEHKKAYSYFKKELEK